MAQRSRSTSFALFLVLFIACSHYERIPCVTSADCLSGICVEGHCVHPPSVLFDIVDVEGGWARGDEGDTLHDEGVLKPDLSADEALELDTPYDSPPELGDTPSDFYPGDVGPAVTTGLPCKADSECLQGSCILVVPGRGLCSGPCDKGCPLGMACLPIGKSESGALLTECRPFPQGLCLPCNIPQDCPAQDAQCLPMDGGNFCTTPCNVSSCPIGFECRLVVPGIPAQCVPTMGTCACTENHLGHTFECAAQSPAGLCLGEMACTEQGFTQCSASLPEPESCDGKDNDCDGETDEDFTFVDWDGSIKGIGAPCGTGACAGGEVLCISPKAAQCSSAIFMLEAEVCRDGQDNDCDGLTDEGCWPDDLDGDGTPNDLDCAPFDAARHKGAYEPCCPISVPAESQVEACDFNCDGEVTLCDIGDLDGDGFASASFGGDDCDDSDPTIYPSAPERCGDGIDQDCDGSDLDCSTVTDNDGDGWPLQVDCNDDDPSIHPWATEICNYIDDDCDGVTDEGNPGDGTVSGGDPCGPQIGVCKPGVWVCSHKPPLFVQMECVGGVGPTEEQCNGLDDDCDGETDEDFKELGLPCDGPDSDKCKNGVYTCAPNKKEVICAKETKYDIAEVCGNGKDDDCDGIVDNGCLPGDLDGDGYLPPEDCDDTRAEVHKGAKEPCCDPKLEGDAACDWNCDGLVTPCDPNDHDLDGHVSKAFGGDDCADDDPTTFPGAPERCGDGIDQDCDGKDLPCAGLTDKDGDGYPPPLDCNDSNPNIHPWAEEVCNGKDDDCDGIVDEGNPGGGEACGSDEGECSSGIMVCVHFPYQARLECAGFKGPSPEVCDGLDNNCNGLTDEFFEGLGKPCDGPDPDLCKNGVIVCSEDGSGTMCLESGPGNVEVCDGKDNDCDGLTDEGFTFEGAPLGAPCDGLGECGQGIVVCHKDKTRAICSTMPTGPEDQSRPEICDGLDNDCDGQVDNGMLYLGLPVGAPCLGYGACGPGVVECNLLTGKATCSSNPDGSKPKAKPEVCNGLDDDCDGHTDEDLTPNPSDCKQLGVCAGHTIPAKCKKGAWQCDYSVVPNYQAEEDLCDGLDNDCDGETDEGYPVGLPCDGPDSDMCKNGTYTCTKDGHGWECVNETVTDIKEQCNGLDDDCDGATDEDFPVGLPCDGPDTDQCPNGTWTCTGDGFGVECTNETVTDIQETCNGLDDDCDGLTDEDWPVGLPCDGPDTDQCPNGTWTCTGDGLSVECTNETVTDIQETCNGLDDDCNGATDEGFYYDGLGVGEPCDGIGECGLGKVECTPDGKGAQCSTNPGGSEAQDTLEVCDGLDNDCDGLTDEDQTYEGNALGAPCVAKGECGPGIVVCSPTDLVATCSTAPNGTEPKSRPEVCDLKDNDCNGVTDDVAEPDKSSCLLTGVCTPTLVQAFCIGGQWVCNYDHVPGYEPGDEVTCDGLDNDCDGLTDEAWPIGLPCDGPDEDLCKNGTWTCDPSGKGVECVNETVQNIKEVCNGLDDDCDGLTDEEGAQGCTVFYFDQDSDGYGAPGALGRCLCEAGQVPYFTALNTGDCDEKDPDVHPGARERCNGLDDDCDNLSDEDFPQKGMACDGPDPDECANGIWACKADGTGLECINDVPVPEVCDGKDNDCDGLTDEEWPVGQPCDGPDSDMCKNGTWTCTLDHSGVECINETVQNITERCNGLDDDCDGLVDEDWPDKGKACVVGLGECQRSGTYVCKADGSGITCNAVPGQPSTEVCDNKDNDCNGITDDPWAADKGRKCDTNPNPPSGPACALGIFQCRPDKTGLQCVGDVDCVAGSQCLSSGSDYLPDSCLCGTDDHCTADVASQCSATLACLCGSGPKCTPPLKCISGTCK